MPTPVLFPDVVLLAVNYLRDRLVGATVTAKVQLVPPAVPTVVVRRAGGVAHDRVIDRARVDVQVWGVDEFATAAMAQRVRALLLAAEGYAGAGVQVYRAVDFLGPQAVPDKQTAQPRYLLTVTWSVRGYETP